MITKVARHNAPSVPAADSTPRFLRRMTWFWTLVLYVLIVFNLPGLVARLPGWPGIASLVALIVFCACYHLLYLRDDNWWPMPPRRAVVYFSVQITALAVLLAFAPGFTGLGYALLAHICSLLPRRQWFAPLAALIGVMAWTNGALGEALRGNWGPLGVFLFVMVVFIGIFATFSVLAQQRHQLVQLVQELHRTKIALEAQATQAEELAVLRERARLAREMHDSLGHALVTVNVKLEAAQRLYARDPRRGDAELEATRALVRAALADLRRTLADLRAPIAGHPDLYAALRRLVDEIRATTPIAVTLQVPDALPELAPETGEVLWRVAREALTNVQRHAGAASASLTLTAHDDTLLLRVDDDGSGIRPADLGRPGHYGILGMRERVEACGGTLQIGPRPGGGTTVVARLPLAGQLCEVEQ